MRNHKPQYRLDKERDYIITDASSFFSELRSFLGFLQDSWPWSPTEKKILSDIEIASINSDLTKLRAITEEARKYAWNTMKGPASDKAAFLLSFCVFVESFSYVTSKTPADYVIERRPNHLKQAGGTDG